MRSLYHKGRAYVLVSSVTCEVNLNNKEMVVSFVFASNSAMERRKLWSYLQEVSDVVGSSAWIVLGDFNVLLSHDETSKFDGSQIMIRDMREFGECLTEVGLSDHISSGLALTWFNNQDETFQARKLYRVLINEHWLSRFDASSVEFLLPGCSNHCCSKIGSENVILKLPKPVKMFNFWALHPQFLDVVAESWEQGAMGNPMSKLYSKLKRWKAVLTVFNKEHFSYIFRRV